MLECKWSFPQLISNSGGFTHCGDGRLGREDQLRQCCRRPTHWQSRLQWRCATGEAFSQHCYQRERSTCSRDFRKRGFCSPICAWFLGGFEIPSCRVCRGSWLYDLSAFLCLTSGRLTDNSSTISVLAEHKAQKHASTLFSLIVTLDLTRSWHLSHRPLVIWITFHFRSPRSSRTQWTPSASERKYASNIAKRRRIIRLQSAKRHHSKLSVTTEAVTANRWC